MFGCAAAALASSTACLATTSSWWAALKHGRVTPKSAWSQAAARRQDARTISAEAGSGDVGAAAVIASGIFRKTEPEVVRRLIADMRPVRFGTGHVVFAQGDPQGALFVITSGRVKVVYSHFGREAVLNVLGASDIFGEVAPFDCGPREATAVALTEVHAVAIGRHQLLAWITDCPEVILQIGRLLARRADVMSDCLIDFACNDPAYRIARRLLVLGKRFGHKEGDVVRVVHGLTLEEIALFAGVDCETGAATLRAFGDRGWIRFEDGGFVLIDGRALASLCAEGDCD